MRFIPTLFPFLLRFAACLIPLAMWPLDAQSVVVNPSAISLAHGQDAVFTASVTGITNPSVSWTSSPGGIGSLSSSSGLTTTYTAPANVFSGQNNSVTITATVASGGGNLTASAMVTLVPTVTISVTPGSANVTAGGTVQFTATVLNTTNTGVSWVLTPSVGTINASGLYTAPATVQNSQNVTVKATSAADPTQSATATLIVSPGSSTSFGIGAGAPNSTITTQFINAFYRNNFNNLVSLPPQGNVTSFGSTGLEQLFSANGGGTAALIKPNLSAGPSDPNVYQVLPAMYSYYATVGVGTAGFPTMDTATCPSLNPATACSYQLFSLNYALFVNPGGQNIFIRDPFYTQWINSGGLSGGLGSPVAGEHTATGANSITATAETFASGAIYSLTSGAQSGTLYTVAEPIYDVYVANGADTGFLGLPAGAVVTLPGGVRSQSFQGGSIQYTPGNPPAVQLPTNGVTVTTPSGTSTIRLNLGDTVQLTAVAYNANGVSTGQPIVWVTSNGQVATIQASGGSATVKAVGGGTAVVTATSGGLVSAPVTLFVTAPCCQVGEGAPSTTIQQAFQDAVTRNHLNVLLPASSGVTRLGNGYVQQLQSADPSSTARYLLAKPDQSPLAYLVAGDILTAYLALGGPAGSLGQPISDATTGGRQLFANSAALAGSPARLVSGVILAKWAALGYETGVAGSPVGDAAPFITFLANSGVGQSFQKGAILGATSGSRSGQAFFASGAILTRYTALGGAGGAFGMPTTDEFTAASGKRQQNFEGGYFDYSTGDQVALEHSTPRQPAVNAPSSVTAGSRIRLAVSGFANGSTLRVSITSRPDFLITTTNGAFSWDAFVPLSAQAGVVKIHAADTSSTDAADGLYTIRTFAANQVRITKMLGDSQTGLPGAQLPQVLQVMLRDQAGNPVVGVPVGFDASPGAAIAPTAAVTDASGLAQAALRLPPTEGIALATASAPSVSATPVTFSAQAASSSLANFPRLMATGNTVLGNGPATLAQKGALIASVASILSYHQNRGELANANGSADPAVLAQFLKTYCTTDAGGAQICDAFLSNPDSGEPVVNLWRVQAFVGGTLDISVEKSDLGSIRDLVAQGSPVLLALSLTMDGTADGGHFVVAIGVGPDGGILLHDPSPNFARSGLADYLSGFSAGGHAWKGQLLSSVRLLPQLPSSTRFLLETISQPPATLASVTLDARSAAGACGPAVDLPDAAVFGAAPPASARVSRLLACPGDQAAYQISVGATNTAFHVTLTDLASRGSQFDLSGNSLAVYQATRPTLQLVVAPQNVSFSTSGVVNAATFSPGLSPGGLVSIFGSGLAGTSGSSRVSFNGTPAAVLAATPFQVNAQVPPELAPGSYSLQVSSSFGTAQQPVEIAAASPGIFVLTSAGQGAVVNQDGTLNSPSMPGARGQVLVIYGTGFGAVAAKGKLSVASQTVTAVLNGQDLPVAFAGLTPGFVGLYQVNLPVPASFAPGLGLPLALRQASQLSNIVPVALY